MAYLHSARPEETDPTRVSIIELTVRQLEKQIAELQEIIAALEIRLAPVLCERESPEVRTDNNSVVSGQSQLTVMLHKRFQEVASVASQLSSIMERLEI